MAVPDGSDLCSATVNANTWNNGGIDEEEITFSSPVELTSGTEYAIVVRLPSASGPSWGNWQANWSNPYANGIAMTSSNGGSSWGENANTDFWFQTKASGVVKDSNTAAYTNKLNFSGSLWRAMTFIASSTYTITSVALRVGKFGSPGNAIISIQGTLSAPSKATTPAPADAVTNVTLDQANITWVDGGGADTFDVYYGTESGNLSLVSSAQAGVSFTVTGITNGSPYEYLITRYWRIDSTNAAGTTTGDEWSFTTIRLSAPSQTYWYSAGNYHYRLLIQADGSYGDSPADGGVEDTDYEKLTGYLPNFISTTRKLVGVANSKVWYEDI
jgi:hypothetical protein